MVTFGRDAELTTLRTSTPSGVPRPPYVGRVKRVDRVTQTRSSSAVSAAASSMPPDELADGWRPGGGGAAEADQLEQGAVADVRSAVGRTPAGVVERPADHRGGGEEPPTGVRRDARRTSCHCGPSS